MEIIPDQEDLGRGKIAGQCLEERLASQPAGTGNACHNPTTWSKGSGVLSGWKGAVGGQGGSWLERDVGLIPREDTTEGMAVEFSIKRIPETAQSEYWGQIWFLQRSPGRGCSGWGWSLSCSLPCPLRLEWCQARSGRMIYICWVTSVEERA